MSEQCLGTTKSGSRCKITRNLVDGYCHLHRKQAEEQPEAAPAPATSKTKTPPPPPQPEKEPVDTTAPPPFEEPGDGPELTFDNESGSLKKLFTIFGIVLVIAAFLLKRKRR